MYHWDLPQALQEEGGWPDRKLVDYFVDYATVLFDNFGDRVKHWITFNEPMQICELGYGLGWGAPFLVDSQGPYECTHTVLLAHGKTYRLYDSEYKETQNGEVGIVVDTAWHEPLDPDNESDQEASQLYMEATYSWFVDPLFFGTYPDIVIETAKLRNGTVPEFSAEEKEIVIGSLDFLGLNHYSSDLISFNGSEDHAVMNIQKTHDPEWPGSPVNGDFYVVPWGLRKLLGWINNRYDNPRVVITENGYPDDGDVEDYQRAAYYRAYLYQILLAIFEDGCNVIGYTAWSLIDNMEWTSGYTVKFGLNHVDFDDPERPRTRKFSSYLYQNIVKNRYVDWDYWPDWPPQEK